MTKSHSDPRAASATVIEGPLGMTGPVELFRPFEIDGRSVALPKPLAGVAEYVSVARAEASADGLRACLLDDLDERNSQIAFQTNASLVLDFYAAAGTVVSEAIIGLEAFANHFVTGHFDSESTFVLGDASLTKRDVYNVPLNERFADVVPEILDVPRPTSAPWWPTFRRVQALAALKRHAVFDAVKRNGLEGEKELIQRFVDCEYRGAARMMLDVFAFFVPSWVSPERRADMPAAPN